MLIVLMFVATLGVARAQTYRFDFGGVDEQPEGFVRVTPQVLYTSERGYGYEFLSAQDGPNANPALFSVDVPDGNYKVTAVLGDQALPGATTLRAESRRMFVNNCITKGGELITKTFTVNKYSRKITEQQSVSLKGLASKKSNWDDKLTIEFNGKAPRVASLTIEAVTVPTIFLFGNSTVCDYEDEPYASWGQIIPGLFKENIAFANYAETGETANSCVGSRRFAKGLSQMKPGDYALIELGHNDQKLQGVGVGAYLSFTTRLKSMTDQIIARGAVPVLVTPTERRRWQNGVLLQTHGDYPDAVRALAGKEQIALIDLTAMTTVLYSTYGEQGSKQLFVHIEANRLPNQPKAIRDNTHFSPFGAYQVARCLVVGMQRVMPMVAASLRDDLGLFSPNIVEDYALFNWDRRINSKYEKPEGN